MPIQPSDELLVTRLSEITDENLTQLLAELGQVTGLSPAAHGSSTLLGYLQLTQLDPITQRARSIDAARFIPGSLLRTAVSKHEGTAVGLLATTLCAGMGFDYEPLTNRKLYVFLNLVLGKKSPLRRPAPFRW